MDVLGRKTMPDTAIRRSAFFSLDLLLGLLASSLVYAYYYWKLTGEGVRTGGGFHTYPKTVRLLPVFDATHTSKQEVLILERIEKGSIQLLSLHKQLAAAKTPHEKTALERQIAATDAEIDRLVYDLYGLTEDEIRIVEGQG